MFYLLVYLTNVCRKCCSEVSAVSIATSISSWNAEMIHLYFCSSSLCPGELLRWSQGWHFLLRQKEKIKCKTITIDWSSNMIMIHDNVSTQKRMCVIKGFCAKHEFVESCKVWTLFLRSGQWRRHVSSVAKVSKCAPATICGMGLGMKGCDVKLNVAQCLLWCGYQMLAIIYTRSTCPRHVTSSGMVKYNIDLRSIIFLKFECV